MLIKVKMRTIDDILKFKSWVSFRLSWIEYEKSFITSTPSPVSRTFIEDVCAYIYDEKAYKNLVCWPKYESIRTLSYSFISTSDPTWPEHRRIYSSLRVFAFMRGFRGGGVEIGGPNLLENHNVED